MPNTITGYTTFTPGTKAKSAEVNENFSNHRGDLIPINTDTATASDDTHYLGTEEHRYKRIYTAEPPAHVGTILPFAGTSAPPGALMCWGQELTITAYQDLYDVVGTAFGQSSVTVFNIPDLRGLFIRGVDHGVGNDADAGSRAAYATGGNAGDTLGSYEVDRTRLPRDTNFVTKIVAVPHTHNTAGRYNAGALGNLTNRFAAPNNSGVDYNLTTSSADISHAHTITAGGDAQTSPKSIYIEFIIKY